MTETPHAAPQVREITADTLGGDVPQNTKTIRSGTGRHTDITRLHLRPRELARH